MTFEERVRTILLFKGIKQRDFARLTKLHESRVSTLLNEKSKPTTRELMTFIKVLNY